MSERMTGISLPGVFGSGLGGRGRKSVPEMIATYRRYAESQKALFDAILAASDDDFHITTHTGVYVERNIEVLQPGRPKPVKKATTQPTESQFQQGDGK